MGISFDGMDDKVVELFREIECKRCINQDRGRSLVKRSMRRGGKEVRDLALSINYEGSGVRRGRSKRRMWEERSGDGDKAIVLSDEAKHPIVER